MNGNNSGASIVRSMPNRSSSKQLTKNLLNSIVSDNMKIKLCFVFCLIIDFHHLHFIGFVVFAPIFKMNFNIHFYLVGIYNFWIICHDNVIPITWHEKQESIHDHLSQASSVCIFLKCNVFLQMHATFDWIIYFIFTSLVRNSSQFSSNVQHCCFR